MPTTASADLSGWVPIHLIFPGENDRYPHGAASWLDCSGVEFSDPFFLQTILRLRTSPSPRLEALTKLSSAGQIEPNATELDPAGIIFQISRCGSTAVANALRSSHGVQVVSEVWPITQLLWQAKLSSGSDIASPEPSNLDLIRNIAWALSRCRTGTPEKLVLKFTSSSLLSFGAIRTLWPHTPAVLIVRHPLEVLVANLASVNWLNRGWLAREQMLLGSASSTEASNLSDEEYGARVLKTFLESATGNIDSFKLVLDHQNISVDAIKTVAELFGLRPATDELIAGSLNRNAKSNDVRYESDSELRRESASGSCKEAIDAIAMTSYRELIDVARSKGRLFGVKPSASKFASYC